MKQVTRNIDPDSAHDLLERVPRACITFAYEHKPQAQPVALVWRDSRYLVGIPENIDLRPNDGDEVVLLVDEGIYFFDLRAIYIRGQIHPTELPQNAPVGHRWFEVIPLKKVAWDYGSLREVGDES
ncbi:MAG: hypothetical protein ABI947_10500 [Chloroflexota bacterium]